MGLQPDTDLGERAVTVAVGLLTEAETREALANGRAVAEDFRRRGLIHAAALALNGKKLICSEEQRQLVGEHA